MGTFLNFPIKEFIAQKYSFKQSNNISKLDNNNIKKENNDLIIQTQPKRKMCTIIYNNNQNIIKIFDKNFIKNNKDKFYLIINNEKTELKEYIEINNKELKQIEIKLYETKPITNMSYMFYECSSLQSLPDISKWNTEKVTNMYDMFYYCTSLQYLPDISKWETKNVASMSYIFCNCSSLLSILIFQNGKLKM